MTIVTITGPSCSGKSTLEKMLCLEPNFERVISHTTRPMRVGEESGKDYFFVSQDDFQTMLDAGEFVEVVEFNGNKYGATRDQFLSILGRGNHAVVVVEPAGREAIIEFAEQENLPIMPVFVSNPARVIARRFLERYTSELALALGKTGVADKVLATYASRLDTMMTEETQWRSAQYPTALRFFQFNEENDASVVKRIIRGANVCPRPGDTIEDE